MIYEGKNKSTRSHRELKDSYLKKVQ